MEKKTSPAKEQDQFKGQSNSTVDQRNRLAAALRNKHAVTTTYARKELDILAPAARVWELRHQYGMNIKTHWQTVETAPGKTHRVAGYVLFPGKWKEAAA